MKNKLEKSKNTRFPHRAHYLRHSLSRQKDLLARLLQEGKLLRELFNLIVRGGRQDGRSDI